jgi:spore coat polysaccharide biosynthesis protein SpsF
MSSGSPRRTLCVVQARTGSSRLPGKVLADVRGRPMLRFLLDRLDTLDVDELVVATSTEARDDAVAEIAAAAARPCVRGSEQDVLGRFVSALDAYPAQHVVRITADCPLSDPALIEAVVARHVETGADYTTNTLPRTFPKGLDVEVATADALRTAAAEAVTGPEREHVMPFLYRRPERFRLANLRNALPLGSERWTVDTADDLAFVRAVCDRLDDVHFAWRDVLAIVPPGTATPAVEDESVAVLRPIYGCDNDFTLECRNDADAVRYSRSCQTVTAGQHHAWFSARLRNPGAPMWVGEVAGRRVGTVRVDVETGVGEVGIAVHPRSRGKGYGRALLAALLTELAFDQQVVDLVARVREDNEPSLRAFRGVGFTDSGTEGAFVVLRRDPHLPMENV